jgi:hypothetical protein
MTANSENFDSVQALVPEIERYLAVVDCFRSLGCEPRWSAEAVVQVEASAAELAPTVRAD